MAKTAPSLAQRILKHLGTKDYVPLKQHELAHALSVKKADRPALRHTLRDLEQKGKIICLRKNRWALPSKEKQITGTLLMMSQGFAFVKPDDPEFDDIYVADEATGNALDGDHVMIALTKRIARKRPSQYDALTRSEFQGRVIRIIERRRKRIVGVLRRSKFHWYLVPDSAKIHHDIRIREERGKKLSPQQEHHKVVAELDEQRSRERVLTAIVAEDLGPMDQPGIDVLSIIHDFDMETEFSERALKEAQGFNTTPSEADMAGREDLRDLLTCTIDPVDAKDYDDAISLTKLKNGHWELAVHIADVEHYVKPKSAVDRDAYLRGNSVYLVDRAIPMLPPYLTKDICSLIADIPRLAHTVIIELDTKAEVIATRTCSSVILSRQCLSYDQVQKFFDGAKDHGIDKELIPALKDLRQLASAMRAKRMAAGSIDFNVPEVKFELNAQGKPVRVAQRGSGEAYAVIEECMLQANCAVARILMEKEGPALYRVHDEPSDEQWAAMGMELATLGISPLPTSSQDMNIVARKTAGTPAAYAAALIMLRSMKRAMYSAEASEHFGLGFMPYTHFTSPIRRYPDLIVHRLLRAIEEKKTPPYSKDEIAQLASHCCATERAADEAERESVAMKRIQLYEDRLSRGETGPYEGVIVTIVKKGLIVEITESLQRGLVPFSSMHDDHYKSNDEGTQAVGRRGRHTWSIGHPIEVRLVRVDTTRKLIDFEPWDTTKKKRPKNKTKGRSRKKPVRKRRKR